MAKFLFNELPRVRGIFVALALFVADTFLFDAADFLVFLTVSLPDDDLAGFFVVAVPLAALTPPALEFQPNLFNLPTTAFLDIPKRLPISDVDKPLPVKAFNFFSVALSQPLLISKNPCYT